MVNVFIIIVYITVKALIFYVDFTQKLFSSFSLPDFLLEYL